MVVLKLRTQVDMTPFLRDKVFIMEVIGEKRDIRLGKNRVCTQKPAIGGRNKSENWFFYCFLKFIFCHNFFAF